MKKSFTLIELLVVIAIIGILSSLILVNINTGRGNANLAKVAQESSSMAKAFAVYENNYTLQDLKTGDNLTTTLKQICNTNITGVDCSGKVDVSDLVTKGVLGSIPVDPNNTDPAGTGYWIASTHDGNGIMLVPGLYKASCPTGYVSVPGNSFYNTLPGFCVMKYEAKCSESATGACGNPGSYKVVSQAGNRPWVNITQINAKERCSDSGAHLITNNEWMTIARNVEAQGINWTGAEVDNGVVFRGHCYNNPSSTLGASSDDGDGYFGINSPEIDNRRTHYLTNGEVLWDMSGNAWTLTDEVVIDKNMQPNTSADPSNKYWGWSEFNALNYFGQYTYDHIAPSQPHWTEDEGGMGGYISWDDSNRVFIRGGVRNFWQSTGILALIMMWTPSTPLGTVSFRCAK